MLRNRRSLLVSAPMSGDPLHPSFKPALRLGAPVSLDGEARTVVGAVRWRHFKDGRVHTELRLSGEPARSLVYEDGHWSVRRQVQPAAADALGEGWTVAGARSVGAINVIGEAAAETGEMRTFQLFASPPLRRWLERGEGQVRSAVEDRYLPPAEAARVLGVPEARLPRRSGVLPHQPYASAAWRTAVARILALATAAWALSLLVSLGWSGSPVLSQVVPGSAWGQRQGPEASAWTTAMELPAGVVSVSVRHGDAQPAGWAYVHLRLEDASGTAALRSAVQLAPWRSLERRLLVRVPHGGEWRLSISGGAGAAESRGIEPVVVPPLQLEVRSGLLLTRWFALGLALTALPLALDLAHRSWFVVRRRAERER